MTLSQAPIAIGLTQKQRNCVITSDSDVYVLRTRARRTQYLRYAPLAA